MGAEISSLDWHTPFRVEEKLTPEQEEEFAMNLEAANDLINNPEYLMEHIQRLFPDDESVPIEMVRSISQSFIDRLRVHDEPVLHKVGLFFQDVASNNSTGVSKSVLRGYLASILSILLTAALEEATRLKIRAARTVCEEEATVNNNGDTQHVFGSPEGSCSGHISDQHEASTAHGSTRPSGNVPERYTIASSGSAHSSSSASSASWTSSTDSSQMRVVNVPSTIPEETESELKLSKLEVESATMGHSNVPSNVANGGPSAPAAPRHEHSANGSKSLKDSTTGSHKKGRALRTREATAGIDDAAAAANGNAVLGTTKAASQVMEDGGQKEDQKTPAYHHAAGTAGRESISDESKKVL